MNFKIYALDHKEFTPYFNLSDIELEKIGVQKMIVDEYPGYPCRVSLEDAEIGEEVLLLSYNFHKTNSPYNAKGPIFVRKNKATREYSKNEIPKMLLHRLLSFRGYDKNGIMKSAITESGQKSKEIIEEIFENNDIEYIHIHNSSPGCYNCEVKRN